MQEPALPSTLAELLAGFPPVTLDDWRAAAARALGDAGAVAWDGDPDTDDPLIKPLSTAADVDPAALVDLPPLSPRPAGAWTISQRYTDPDVATVNRQILADLERGADGIWLRLDRAARRGLSPDQPSTGDSRGVDGIALTSAEDLERLLEGVHLDMVHIAFDAGASAFAIPDWFRDLARRRGAAPASLRVGFDCDPLGTLAAEGHWPGSRDKGTGALVVHEGEIGDLVGLFNTPSMRAAAVRMIGVSTLPYLDAGPADQLSYALATAVAYLRPLSRYGWDAATSCDRLRFLFAIGDDFFTEIAKLRAARRLWARVMTTLGGNIAHGEPLPMEIHALAAPRAGSPWAASPDRAVSGDPWVDLARGTARAMAAAIGGADRITLSLAEGGAAAHDPAAGAVTSRGPGAETLRRLALGAQTILQAECRLPRIADAAGGSYHVERLTDRLCRRAWDSFQAIEREGGMAAALHSGRIGTAAARGTQTP